MRRKLLFLLVLIAIILAVVGVLKVLADRSPKEGELRVESTPVATIFLDNKNLGRTPVREKVTAGEYTLKIVPETTTQFSSWQGKVAVGPNLLTYVNSVLAESELTSAVDTLWLERISGKRSELSVLTNPDGASVMLDDQTKGVTPLTISDITPGDHSLNVASLGFLSRMIKIKTTPGYKLIASLKLALSAGAATVSATTPTPTASPTGTIKPTPTPTKVATSSAAFPDPPRPFALIKDTPTGFLRVRTEPSTSATEAARVKPGEKYTIVDEKSGWYQIKYDTTNTGWISGQYADKIE